MELNGDLQSIFDRVAKTSRTIAVLGSMNADYTVETERLPLPGETVSGGPLHILPGGKSANQAAAASRIGAHVMMLGAVGDDGNAEFLLSHLQDAGVDVSAVKNVPGPSGTTVITVDSHAENTIVYSAGSNAKVDAAYAQRSADAISGSAALGLCLESPIEAVNRAAGIAHKAGVKVLLNNSPFRADLPDELIADSDILLVNEHEMSQLLGIDEPDDGRWSSLDWDALAHRMELFGFHEAIVTLGSQGAYVLSSLPGAPRSVFVPAVAVHAVDTTGCGDAFMGSVLAGITAGLDLGQCAHLATYVAAYAATGVGAQSSYGTSAEILDRFL